MKSVVDYGGPAEVGVPRRRMLVVSALVLAAVAASCLLVLTHLRVGVQPDNRASQRVAEATRTRATNPPPQGAVPAAASEVAWTAVSVDAVDPWRIPTHGGSREDAVLVAFGTDIRTWRAGDRVTLTVPQTGGAWVTTIAAVEGAGSNRSYVGRLESGPFPASFVVTVGPRHTFAHLGTPLGSYELTGNTEFAWLSRTVDDWHGDDLDYSVSRPLAPRHDDG